MGALVTAALKRLLYSQGGWLAGCKELFAELWLVLCYDLIQYYFVITNCRHLLVHHLAAILIGVSPLHATDSGAIHSIRFFGRWDLRKTDRAITVNSGSYLLAHFSGSSISAHFDLAVNQPPLPVLTWRIDNGEWQYAEVTAGLKLAEGLAAGPHTLWLMVRGLDEHQSRWRPPLVASVTFLGLDLPAGGRILTPLAEWDNPKLKIEFLGDSITEGVLVGGPHEKGKATWAWNSNALESWVARTALALGAMWRQVGFGATGINHGGSGGAIAAQDSFNFFYEGCPRDEWQPDLVVINQGTNNARDDGTIYLPLYGKYLATIRMAYPRAKIAAVSPFCGAQADSIKMAVEAARAAGDHEIYFVDTTGWYSGSLHPSAKACTEIAAKLTDALKSGILNANP